MRILDLGLRIGDWGLRGDRVFHEGGPPSLLTRYAEELWRARGEGERAAGAGIKIKMKLKDEDAKRIWNMGYRKG